MKMTYPNLAKYLRCTTNHAQLDNYLIDRVIQMSCEQDNTPKTIMASLHVVSFNHTKCQPHY